MKLIFILRSERPDILHQVAIKPILLGSLAARFAGVRTVLNAIVGGGYAFTSSSPLMRVLRPFLSFSLRFLLSARGSRVVFENSDDLKLFVSERYVKPSRAILIRGAGVNPLLFSKHATLAALPLVVLPARLLWDKGLGEFVEAARLLRNKGLLARFAIVGGVDPGNRASISSDVLDKWRTEGIVELWCFQTDMPRVLSQADVVCLPSYREGLPKALLEGMAAGLPCVATDVPGCREAVRDGDNGILVPAKEIASLAVAIETLLSNPDLAKRMGARGRQRVEKEFSERYVNESTLGLYREMLLE